jgi:hypothetical protein
MVEQTYWTSRENSLKLIELSSINNLNHFLHSESAREQVVSWLQ